jgi:IS5 family transposase
MVKTLK